MAATNRPTASPDFEVYLKVGKTIPTKAATYGDVVGTGKLVTALGNDTNRVLDADPTVDLTITGNSISYTPAGSKTTKNVSGAGSLPEIPITFTVTESNTVHTAILNSDTGDWAEGAIVVRTGNNTTVYWFYGTVGGVGPAFSEGPNSATITIALREKWVRVHSS